MSESPSIDPRSAERQRVRRRRFRRLRAVALVPTLFTLANLVCGFAAIFYAAKDVGPSKVFGWSSLTVAGTLVLLGMFFDGIDGLAARLTRSASAFGAQLDSMADMVTFGVAPAFMMLRLVSHYYGPDHYTGILGPDADSEYAKIIWGVAAIYICCTALRLARFNVEVPSTEEEAHRWFRGLPSPGAAGAVASLILLHEHLYVITYHNTAPERFAKWSSLFIPLVTLLVAVAMVSRLRYAHVLNRWIRGKRDFAWVARVVIPIAFLAWWLQPAMAAVFVLYAVSGPLGYLLGVMRLRSHGVAP